MKHYTLNESFFFSIIRLMMNQALRIKKKKRFLKRRHNNFLYVLNINFKKILNRSTSWTNRLSFKKIELAYLIKHVYL